jgi:hypothetical protein
MKAPSTSIASLKSPTARSSPIAIVRRPLNMSRAQHRRIAPPLLDSRTAGRQGAIARWKAVPARRCVRWCDRGSLPRVLTRAAARGRPRASQRLRQRHVRALADHGPVRARSSRRRRRRQCERALYFVALVDRGVGTGRFGGHLVFEHLALLEEARSPCSTADTHNGRPSPGPRIISAIIGWPGNFIRQPHEAMRVFRVLWGIFTGISAEPRVSCEASPSSWLTLSPRQSLP